MEVLRVVLILLLAVCVKPGSSTTCLEVCSCSMDDAVDCSNRQLESLHGIVPVKTSSLILSHNSFKYLNSTWIVEAKTSLSVLDISHNSFDLIPRDFINQATELTDLNLSNNNISFGFDDFYIFLPNRKLVTLDLSSNRIDFLFPSMFQSLSKLESINLSDNLLRTFSFYMFHGSLILKNISLMNNKIDNLFFILLSEITAFDLRGNLFQFTSETDIFMATPFLFDLKFGHSNLRYFNGNFDGLTKLKSLELLEYSNTSLVFENSMSFSKTLSKLKIFKGGVEFISIKDLKNLKVLKILGLDVLTELTVNNCPLKNLKDFTFSNVSSLRQISITYSDLRDFNAADLFLGKNNLTKLTISNSFLSDLKDGSFDVLANLEELDLSLNQIEHLPTNIFMKLSRLKTVHLSGNVFLRLSEHFLFSSSIVTLNISRNFIKYYEPNSFEGITALNRLDISFNDLRIFNINTSRTKLRIEAFGNRWHCNCTVYNQLNAYFNLSSHVCPRCYVCGSPFRYSGRPVSHLKTLCSIRRENETAVVGPPANNHPRFTVSILAGCSAGILIILLAGIIYVTAIKLRRRREVRRKCEVSATETENLRNGESAQSFCLVARQHSVT